jgi:Universal stress protein family
MERNGDEEMTAAPVVVGVDGSEESTLALRWAFEYAQMSGAPVQAVAACEIPVTYDWTWPALARVSDRQVTMRMVARRWDARSAAWTGSWTASPDNPSAESAVIAMIGAIGADNAMGARGPTSHNPPVMGSSPTPHLRFHWRAKVYAGGPAWTAANSKREPPKASAPAPPPARRQRPATARRAGRSRRSPASRRCPRQHDHTAASATAFATQLAAGRQSLEADNARYEQWSADTYASRDAAGNAAAELRRPGNAQPDDEPHPQPEDKPQLKAGPAATILKKSSTGLTSPAPQACAGRYVLLAAPSVAPHWRARAASPSSSVVSQLTRKLCGAATSR